MYELLGILSVMQMSSSANRGACSAYVITLYIRRQYV